jgi:hypothetical protein
MSTIRAIYDVATSNIAFENHAGPYSCNLLAALERHGQAIDIRGLTLGAIVKIDGTIVQQISLPPPGVQYRSTDQNTLGTSCIRPFPPDGICSIDVWVQSRDGARHESSITFTIPRPKQPYPSWSWNGIFWNAPEPYPDDSEGYKWDEAVGAWVPHTKPDEV